MGHDMMHALSEQLGGQIEITETQGGGRTVWVKFRMSRTVLI
jgi:nitrate/nitrite-specific signal transduction histidine kinase